MTINTTDLTLFQRETAPGAGTYVTIAQVIKIKPGDRKRKKLETYIHDQSAPKVNYGAEEAISAEIELAYDDDQVPHQQFLTDYEATASVKYRIVSKSGRTRTFTAIIESISEGDYTAEGEVQTATIVFGMAAAPVNTW